MNDTFAVRLLKAMNAKGYNVTQFAEAAFLNRTYVYNLINGINKPSIKTLFRLCKALDTDPNTLLGWNDETH